MKNKKKDITKLQQENIQLQDNIKKSNDHAKQLMDEISYLRGTIESREDKVDPSWYYDSPIDIEGKKDLILGKETKIKNYGVNCWLNAAFQTLIALSGDKIKSSKLLTTTIPLDNYVQLKRVLRVFFNEKSKTLYLRQYLGHITRDKDAKNFFGKAFKINQHLDTLDGYFYLINQLDGAFLQLESQDPHIGENRTLSTFLLRMSEKAKKKKSKIEKKTQEKTR